MRLSEAIRLGSMMKPQGFNGWKGETSCAMMAAAEATGVQPEYDVNYRRYGLDYKALYLQFPELATNEAVCPQCNDGTKRYLSSVISIHLNDRHKWTRERIADWVETIERQQEAIVAEPTELAAKS